MLYVLKVALCLSILLWVYRQFLVELAFFSWSRAFFLLAIPVSFAVPLLELPLMPMSVKPEAFFAYSATNENTVVFFHSVPNFDDAPEKAWLLRLAFGIYLLGVLIFLSNMLRNLFRIKQKANRHQRESIYHSVRVSDDEVPAWSFFNFVFINRKVSELPNEEREQVILHEQTHAKQYHSADTLLYELATVMLWFNPLMPIIKREIVTLHEYLADRAVTKLHDAQQYSRLILELANGKQVPQMTEGFTKQQVKKRLLMLNKPPESELKKLRFLLAIPLVVVLMLLFSLMDHAVLKNTDPSALSNSQWEFPFTDRFAVVQPFIEKTTLETPEQAITISHKRVAIVAKADQEVVAIANGTVLNTWLNTEGKIKSYGLSLQTRGNMVFVVDGLQELKVQKGENIKRKQPIGTTGEASLFPTVKIELWKNRKRVDPLLLF